MKFSEWVDISRITDNQKRIHRLLLFVIPFILGALLILTLWIMYDNPQFIQIVSLIFLYFIPPAGKESIIPAAIALGFSWQTVCFVFTYVDMVLCLFMLWNFNFVCKIPILGRWVYFLVQNGSNYLSKHSWVERFCFMGLITFIFLPLQGSGSIGGSILGRILGMSPYQIFTAVFIGTMVQSYLIGVSMFAIQEYLDLNLWYLVVLVLLLMFVMSSFSLIVYLLRKK
ncbi:small multi-drug export protein [Methanospirillum stamsii]|uniref:small multi-drug export protein n=1 Tax=Methanospirillum stamsii TaxID=1277351 RepID=UPI0011B1CEB0|nr:small multi-drug export protein [Methanospirillum stamsii]